ncbi:MAG TPA: hypothetical protein VFY93_04410 [Planctomycetota bacterium]|nr:hypothetical protein [Planctomycetota bacterium]
MRRILPLPVALLLLLAVTAAGKNVDLVTLPDRASVQLTIYNSEDLTLVRETREIALKRGRNQLQFSWANTLIDPTSVEFRPLEKKGEIELVDTRFPGSKPQHLVWTIDSQVEGQVKVEVSYFTSGITWSMDYVALTDAREESLAFRGYVRVSNGSGEEYEDAQVRLIVGRINLVEKIAALAQRRGLPSPPAEKSALFNELKKEGARAAFAEADARDQAAGKEIVKEGLSEYFMFSVSGTETIRHGWSKRMEAVRADGVKFATVYRLREHQYGPRPVRFFLWKNDAEHGLGGSPLPDGRLRVLRTNADEGLSVLGEEAVSYVPIQAPIEINLGPDDRVDCETVAGATRRYDFRFDHRPARVVGWTEETKWQDRVRNSRGKEIVFELQRVLDGDVEHASEVATRLFDYRTIETRFVVAPRGETTYPSTVVRRLGASQRQQRVVLR